MSSPSLTFFCELEAAPLAELFAQPGVLDDLKALGAGVSLGIIDLSAERAAVVQQLTAAGIPVTAWQLLPKEQGYWYNANNAAQASARYGDFKAWSAEHNLTWAAIGIDIEFDHTEIEKAVAEGVGALVPAVLSRLFDPAAFTRAKDEYSALVNQMRADGHAVESYVMPPIVDERRVKATTLQRITGLLDVAVDREVFMLYTSFFSAGLGDDTATGILWSYGPDAQAIGVGSTGGGVTVAGADQIATLSWEQFTRDLKLAARWTDHIYVFSLEGCIQQGYLAHLRQACTSGDFTWTGPLAPPVEAAQQVDRFRAALRAVLWLTAHPLLVVGVLLALLWLGSRRRSRRARRGK